MKKKKIKIGSSVVALLVVGLGLIWLIPIFFALVNSFKDMLQVTVKPMSMPESLYLDNYTYIWKRLNYPRLFINSSIVLIFSELGIILFASMAGYWLARRKNKLAIIVRNYFTLSIFIPFQAIMICLVSVMSKMSLINSLEGLIIVNIGLTSSMALFLFYGYIRQIPVELDEAGKVDGASSIRIFFKIIFPMLAPMTSTVIILTSLTVWNGYLLPLILLQNEEVMTLPVGTANVIYGAFFMKYNYAITALVMAAIPMIVLFLYFQKRIISGVVDGSVKG
jgi:raffinose/stachyose/melibiose transport system permease protein